MKSALPLVVVISGLDPTGGAGLLADIRALSAGNVRIAPIMSATTVQGRRGIISSHVIPIKTILRQLETIFDDFTPASMKIGMVGSPEIAYRLAEFLDHRPELPVVLDPIWKATHGGLISDSSIKESLISALIPRMTIITPNLPELTWLTGIDDSYPGWIQSGADQLLTSGCRAVLVKGGHSMSTPTDRLFMEHEVREYSARRSRRHIRGTGCHLSSYIASQLAHGFTIPESVASAKRYIQKLFANYASACGRVFPAWSDHSQ